MKFIRLSTFFLLMGLAASLSLDAKQKSLKFPKIIQHSWQLDAHRCRESELQYNEGRLVITPNAAHMNEETIKPQKIAEISRDPLAWRIHAISNIAPPEIQTTADIYVLNGDYLTITDGKTTREFVRCK